MSAGLPEGGPHLLHNPRRPLSPGGPTAAHSADARQESWSIAVSCPADRQASTVLPAPSPAPSFCCGNTVVKGAPRSTTRPVATSPTQSETGGSGENKTLLRARPLITVQKPQRKASLMNAYLAALRVGFDSSGQESLCRGSLSINRLATAVGGEIPHTSTRSDTLQGVVGKGTLSPSQSTICPKIRGVAISIKAE